MPDLCVADGWFSRVSAFEEIPHVVVTDIQPPSSCGKWFGQHLGVAGFDRPASYPDPARRAEKSHAMLLPVRIDDPAVPGICGRTATSVCYSVGVRVLHIVKACRRKTFWNHLRQLFPGHGHGATPFQSHAPQGDVVVVRAPVGHRAA